MTQTDCGEKLMDERKKMSEYPKYRKCEHCNSNVKIKYEPLDNIGCLMTLKEFIKNVKSHALMDYDGFGYYSFKNKQSNFVVHPSDNFDNRFTHVMWYNK